MNDSYVVAIELARKSERRAVQLALESIRPVEVDDFGDSFAVVLSCSETAKALVAKAKDAGLAASLSIGTRYERDEAFAGVLGMLAIGPGSNTAFRATFPPDAFDLSTGCPRCGLGAAQTKPQVLAATYKKSQSNFEYGHQGTLSVFMRSEIGLEIVEATGQPWCMRHPVTKSGETVKEWMEAVPCATMPPLSPQSEGVMFGATLGMSRVGEGPKAIPPCDACGRVVWSQDHQRPLRLKYSKAAAAAAQKHAVVAMYEPRDLYPQFDVRKRTYMAARALYGLPGLLFNHVAIRVIMKYAQTEHVRDSASIVPIFSE